MSYCSNCKQPISNEADRCPHCNSLNSKIDGILAKEAAEAEKNSFKGQMKTVFQADDKKQALLLQLKRAQQALTKEVLFTFFIVFAFIFAMTLTVI